MRLDPLGRWFTKSSRMTFLHGQSEPEGPQAGASGKSSSRDQPFSTALKSNFVCPYSIKEVLRS